MKKPLLLLLLVISCTACKQKKTYPPIDNDYYDCLLSDSVVPNNIRKPSLDSAQNTTTIPTEVYSERSRREYDDTQHPGTPPDDNMYGFDPLDDIDDEWNLEHFQTDPYPDDDY